MNQINENAIKTLARECIAKYKKENRKMKSPEIAKLMKPYKDKALLLGCDGIHFNWYVGIESGAIKER